MLILMNIVMVLGMCFFAGGLRFAEQGFDASKTVSPPGVMNLAEYPNCPSFSCNADSFFTLEHQRWRCSHACCIPLLSELANRYSFDRSEISYSEDEPWCRHFLPPTREYVDFNVFIRFLSSSS